MTFPEWYDSIIVPQLNETLKNVPVQAREALRTASRQTMAACWNAAIDEVLKTDALVNASSMEAREVEELQGGRVTFEVLVG